MPIEYLYAQAVLKVTSSVDFVRDASHGSLSLTSNSWEFYWNLIDKHLASALILENIG